MDAADPMISFGNGEPIWLLVNFNQFKIRLDRTRGHSCAQIS